MIKDFIRFGISLLIGLGSLSFLYSLPFEFGSAGFSLDQIDGLEAVESKTVATATTTITFSGLNSNEDGHYLLLFNLVNNSGSVQGYNLFANDDQTITNYYHQRAGFVGTVITASRPNNAYISTLSAIDLSVGYAFITLDNAGYFRASSNTNRGVPGSNIMAMRYVVSVNTFTNINSITLVSQFGVGISSGSTFDLYKIERK